MRYTLYTSRRTFRFLLLLTWRITMQQLLREQNLPFFKGIFALTRSSLNARRAPEAIGVIYTMPKKIVLEEQRIGGKIMQKYTKPMRGSEVGRTKNDDPLRARFEFRVQAPVITRAPTF